MSDSSLGTPRIKFQPKYNNLHCAASFERPVRASPPTCTLCVWHQNTTEMGKASFKVRKIPNSQSTPSAGRCASIKIRLIMLKLRNIHKSFKVVLIDGYGA